MSQRTMFYVAADPSQPGTCWAVTRDDPAYRKQVASDVAQWIRQGAIIRRVSGRVAERMLANWKPPQRRQRVAATSLANQIRRARAKVARMPPEKRATIQLEGQYP